MNSIISMGNKDTQVLCVVNLFRSVLQSNQYFVPLKGSQ